MTSVVITNASSGTHIAMAPTMITNASSGTGITWVVANAERSTFSGTPMTGVCPAIMGSSLQMIVRIPDDIRKKTNQLKDKIDLNKNSVWPKRLRQLKKKLKGYQGTRWCN